MAQTGSSGLGASIWASQRSHTYSNRDRFDPRSRSVPPTSTTPSSAANGSSAPLLTPAPAPSMATPAAATTTSAKSLGPAQLLHRLEQTCLRLRWKSIDLESSWNRAQNPLEHGWTTEHAEGNFKVDFYEFYAWIEQALVLLQRIFGVEIMAGGGMWSSAAASGGTMAGHAFHHNVLKALEDEENPLHEELGAGEVRHALWKAKELRNRWKDAAAAEKETPPLRMYHLQWIVGSILSGLEAAYGKAAERVAAATKEQGEEGGRSGDAMMAEESWDWMVETMDWES